MRVAAVQKLLAPLVLAPVGAIAEHQGRKPQHGAYVQHLFAHLRHRRSQGQPQHAGPIQQRHQHLQPQTHAKGQEHAQHDHHQDGRLMRYAQHLVDIDRKRRAAAQRPAQQHQRRLHHARRAAPQRAGQRQRNHHGHAQAHRAQAAQ